MLLLHQITLVNTIFSVDKVKTVSRLFWGADYENLIHFFWLALVFLICDMPQMGKFL